MADRDVEVDIVARDRTGPGTRSASRNLDNVRDSWRKVDGQGKRTLAAAKVIASDMGKGFSKLGGAAKRWAESGEGIGKKVVRGIASGLSTLSDLGGSIGKGLSSAVNAAGPYVQAALAAVLATAAIAAAPLIGAALGGAMVGGAGGMGIVGGLMLASKDTRVAGAIDTLKEDISTQLSEAASSFVPAALSAIKEARGAFSGMLPDLKRLFDASSGFVAPLVRSIGKGMGAALKGITNAVAKAGPIFNVIGQGIEMIGQRVGEAFDGLKDNGAGMAAGLKIVFVLVAGAIQQAGWALNMLVESFEFFVKKIPGGKQWLDSFKQSSDSTKGSANGLASGFQLLGSGATAAADGISRAKEKADEFADSNISLRDAQIQAKNAIADATKTIKENGEAKGFNSKKGRENEAALNSLATAFNAETTAGEKSGRSAKDAAAAYSTNRAKLVAMAEKAGYSKTAAEKLAAQLLKIPKNVNTDINANTGAASTAVETFQRKIDGLHGKTVTVNVRVNSDGSHHVSGKGGSGTLTFADYRGQFAARGEGVSRTGGPTKVESTVNQTLNVSLDGMPFYSYTARAIGNSERRTAWRTKVGRR